MRIPFLLAPFAFAASMAAQVAPDDWIISSINDFIGNTAVGALWQVDAAMTTATRLANQTPNMAGANCVVIDEVGLVYYGSSRLSSVAIPNPSEIFQVVVAGGAVVAEQRLTTGPIDGGSIAGLTLRSDQLWFASDSGNIGWIPKAGGAPTIVMNVNSGYGVNGLAQSITTNGREVFVGTSHTVNTPDPANVWFFDAESQAPVLTPIAFLNGSAFALSLGRDNRALVGRVSGQMWYADHIALTATQVNVGATAPQSNCNGTALNPWTNLVGNVPGYGSTARAIGFYDVASNTWPQTLSMDTSVPSGVAPACEQPFQLFGHGCRAPNNVEPRLSWSGMPMQGQSFTVTLRDAEMGVALLFLGLSDRFGPLGPLPADLGPIGAPGCLEYTSIEIRLPQAVLTGTASQSFTVPTLPALTGLRLHAQWAVFGTAFTTTEAVHIRVR